MHINRSIMFKEIDDLIKLMNFVDALNVKWKTSSSPFQNGKLYFLWVDDIENETTMKYIIDYAKTLKSCANKELRTTT